MIVWFDSEWLDALLSCEKQQTTRKQTDRIKVGDTVQICNQKHGAITDKPRRICTEWGHRNIRGYAHLLGTVVITEVYDITPSEMSGEELEAWAWADGFDSFDAAKCWFEIRYGAHWMHMTWTAICWRGWAERYFEPEEGAAVL